MFLNLELIYILKINLFIKLIKKSFKLYIKKLINNTSTVDIFNSVGCGQS